MTSTKTPAAPAPLADEELVSTAATPRRRRRGLLRGIRRSPWLYLMLLPGVVYFANCKYAPMYGVTLAFQDYLPFLGMADSPWVGWKHFERLFSGPDFGRLLSNTLILAKSRSEEHTSELQSRGHLVCRLLLEKKKKTNYFTCYTFNVAFDSNMI